MPQAIDVDQSLRVERGDDRFPRARRFQPSPSIGFSTLAEGYMSGTSQAAGRLSYCCIGFPDNSHIYDELIPHLAGAGRRSVAFDFLGFGASDKPEGALYSFEQQLGDLEAVVDALGLEKIIPVGHDAGGPAAVNFALRHPTRAAGICLMNAFYGESPGCGSPNLLSFSPTKI